MNGDLQQILNEGETMIKKLTAIAQFLKTRHESKKHGGYDIYEDDLIQISYDTYYPNLAVYINKNDKWQLVLCYNGGGFSEKHHPGAWENYVIEILYPKAVGAQKTAEIKIQQNKDAEFNKKFGPVDDKEIFAKTLRKS